MKFLISIFGLMLPIAAASLDAVSLEREFENLAAGFQGRVGVCAQAGDRPVCLNAGQRFSMQSVIKMLVGIAVMDAVDHKKWKLDTRIRIERKDLSLNVQPLADLVGPDGFETTLGDLVRRATVDSDSAATDILIDRLGGVKEVQGFLDRKGIRGIRIDRDERQLQTETTGVVWRPEFVDPKILSAARAAVPEPLREAAYRKYQSDIRDTSTPDAMAGLLLRLGQGKLLSPRSTSFFLEVMEQTITFPNRLKAGLIEGWRLGHKTGSSGSYKGLTVATNDVGILRGPGGAVVSIVVFLGDSTESDERKSALMAALSRATILHTR